MLAAMDVRIAQGLRQHFERFAERLQAGERRLGFKLAFNAPAVQANLGIPYPLLAGLTHSTLQQDQGGKYTLTGGNPTLVEAEVAVFLGADIPANAEPAAVVQAIAAMAPAIEVVERDRAPETELVEVLTEGVFHRRVVIGSQQPYALEGTPAALLRNGVSLGDVDAAQGTGDAVKLLLHAAMLLEAVGQGLRKGDMVILGAMVAPVAAAANERYEVRLGSCTPADLTFV